MASIVRLIRQIRSLLLDALDARPKKKNHALAFLLPTRTRDESIQNQQRRSNHYTWAHTSDNPRSKLWRNSGMITRCANCISLLRWRLPPQIQSDRGGVYRSKYKIGRASYNWVSRVTAERERGGGVGRGFDIDTSPAQMELPFGLWERAQRPMS